MTCGKVAIGKAMTVGVVWPRSYDLSAVNLNQDDLEVYLLQQVCSQHQNFSIRSKGLHSSQISYALLVVFRRRHDFEDVEGSPGHVVAEHLEVDEL